MIQPSRFIVVDDDPLNNKLCEIALRKIFPAIEIVLFSMPEMAIEYLDEQYSKQTTFIPTVLFLDINMPGMTGWDFLERFNNLGNNVKVQISIFMLSSSVDQRDRDKAATYKSVSGYISKPISKSELSQLFIEWQLAFSN